MRIDHIIYGVRDPAIAAARLLDQHGLGSVEGGQHTELGTSNRIVPMPPEYIELLAAADVTKPFAAYVAQQVAGGDRLLGWAVQVDDIDAVAKRLELDVTPATRTTPSGTELRWRLAGLLQALADPWLPFFIQWDESSAHPSTEKVDHRLETASIFEVYLAGDEGRLRAWLDDAPLPYQIVEGEPGLHRVRIRTSRAEFDLP